MASDIGANVVIKYSADVSDIKRNVKLIQRANTVLAKKLGTDFTRGATVVRTELSKISTSAKQIKLPLGNITNQTKQFTTVLRGANGQLATVRQTVAGAGKNMKVLNTVVKTGATVTRTFGQNLGTLLKRAALTIPVWFALRQGIGSVFRTIKEGLTAIVDFDRALQKARRNLQGTARGIEANFGILRKEVTKLSIETGKSVEDITNAFQKFATVGFDFETSLAGANSATKLSILLFGDATETATAFARSMRVLVDESEDARPASEQLAEVMALTSELWKTNAFELNELTQSLEKFAPVAKTAGFSAEETVKTLAALSTAGLRGGRAGRLLRTSIVRLVTSTDKLAKSLGVKVNPEVDRTFDVFLKTLDALEASRNEAGKVAPAFEKVVKSIFGLRSSDAIKGLIALRKNFQAVLGITGDVANFNNEFEEVNKTIFQLANQFRNLNKEVGKAFVTGLVGGEDFRDTLEEIVELQNKILKVTRAIGEAFRISAQITFGDPSGLIRSLEDANIFEKFILRNKEAKDKLQNNNNEILQNNEKLLKGLNGQLDRFELERLIFEIETQIKLDTKQFDVDKSLLIKAKKELEKTFEDLPPIEPDVEVKIGKQVLTTEEANKLIQSLIDDQLKRLKLDGATELQILKIKDALLKQHDVNDNILSQKQRQLDIERAITEEQKERISFSNESAKLAEIAKTEGLQTAIAISEVLDGTRDFNTFLRQGGERAKILKEQFADFVKNKELRKFFEGRGGEISIKELPRRDFTPVRAKVDFALAKARLGLKESTEENNTALIQNTASINSLINAFNVGVKLSGTQAQRFGIFQAPEKQILDININIDGRNIGFSGTPEAIRELAGSVSAKVAKAVEEKLVNDLKTDNNAPISRATDERIDNF